MKKAIKVVMVVVILGALLTLVTVGGLSGWFKPSGTDMEKVGVVSSYVVSDGHTIYAFVNAPSLTVVGSHPVETNRLVSIRYVHTGNWNEFVSIEYLDEEIE